MRDYRFRFNANGEHIVINLNNVEKDLLSLSNMELKAHVVAYFTKFVYEADMVGFDVSKHNDLIGY